MKPRPITASRSDGHNTQTLDALRLPDALLRLKTVTQAIGLSAPTIYRKLAAGNFPQPIRLGARCTRWRAADIRAWIQAQGAPAKSTAATEFRTATIAAREEPPPVGPAAELRGFWDAAA